MSSRFRSHLAVAAATALATAAAFAIPALADQAGGGEQPASVEAVPAEAVATLPATTVDAGNAGEISGGGNCGSAEAVPVEPGEKAEPADEEGVILGEAQGAGDVTDVEPAGDNAAQPDGEAGVATLCATTAGPGDGMPEALELSKGASIECEAAKP